MIEDFSPYLEASADWKLLPLPGGQTKYWTWLFPLTYGAHSLARDRWGALVCLAV